MPEGHSIFRLAEQFRAVLGGEIVRASSPQGRFTDGARELDGKRLIGVRTRGKHLFLQFAPTLVRSEADSIETLQLTQAEGNHSGEYSAETKSQKARFHDSIWLHVHLGIYGSWRFTGDEQFVAPIRGDSEATGPEIEVTLTESKKTEIIHEIPAHFQVDDSAWAPHEHFADRWFLMPGDFDAFEPIGTVRLRLLTSHGAADLTGPNRCELMTWEEVQATEARLGPDPLAADDDFEAFVQRAATRKKGIGEALMDQAVIAGVGNIYRAEVLYAARLNPFKPAKEVSVKKLRQIWDWLRRFMPLGVESGRVTTIDREDFAEFVERETAADREIKPIDERYYVYQRDGRPCLRCAATIRLEIVATRKLYWCPRCQR